MRLTPNLEVSDVEDVVIDRDQEWVRRCNGSTYYWILLPKVICRESEREGHCRDRNCQLNRGYKSELDMANYVQSLIANEYRWRAWIHKGTVNIVQKENIFGDNTTENYRVQCGRY